MHECFHIFTCTLLVKKINILYGYTGYYHSRFLHTLINTLINFWQDCCVLYRFELSPNFLNTIYIKNKFKECEKKKLRNEIKNHHHSKEKHEHIKRTH